jgi:hypothetical protein
MKDISLFFFLGISFFLPSSLSSLIRECSTIRDVIAEIQPDTLVVFDIDNTLLRPCQMLGSDEWFYYYIKKME